MFDSLYPPEITRFLKHIPSVNGMSPQLTRGAEVIWGYSGNIYRLSVFIQIKYPGVCPDVGTVIINVNRDVTYNFYIFTVTIIFQGIPLAEKKGTAGTFLSSPCP